MGDYLLSWLLLPAALGILSLGCGLLVAEVASLTGARRAEPFPGLLVLPIGFAAVVLVASFVTSFEATAPLAGVGPLAFAVIGFVLGRGRVGAWLAAPRWSPWAWLAAAIPGAAVAAPVVLTGRAGMTGYGRITDLAHQITFIEYLRTDGRAPMVHTGSSFDEVVAKLVHGYPGGTQSVVATMADLAHVDVLWAYQPVLAFVAAMLGLTLYAVLRRAIPAGLPRALAAGVAAQPTILYSYTLAAGIKELSGAAAIALVAAVFAERRPMSWSVLVPGAVAIGAGFAIFSVTILPWVGVLFLVFAAYELHAERRAWLRTAARWAGVWGLAALLTAPAISGGIALFKASGSEGPAGLGNLAAAVPGWSAVGPWITADHRFPLAQYGHPGATYALIAIALALAAIGFARAARSGDRGLTALGIAAAVATAYILRNSAAWVQLKAFCMTAPITLSLAFAGAAALTSLRWLRPAPLLGAVGLAALVAGGVLYGNALQYHSTPLLPYERMQELKHIDDRFAGRGPTLLPNFDEFAEYLTRDARGSGLVDPWRGLMPGNRTARAGFQTTRDTDELDQRFLQTFRLIVRRRDPTASRPPSNYALVDTTDHYEVWERRGDPRRIAAHYPFAGPAAERTPAMCRRIADSVAKAGPGARIAYAAPTPATVGVPPARGTFPPAWVLVGEDLRAGSPGRWSERFTVRTPGVYTMFIRGSFGRRVTVAVDGRQVGALRWRESYPGVYERVATVRMARGPHLLTVLRGGGSLLPGTGNDPSGTTTTIGTVVLAPAFQREAVRSAPASRLRTVCRSGAPLDWIEVVAPAGP